MSVFIVQRWKEWFPFRNGIQIQMSTAISPAVCPYFCRSESLGALACLCTSSCVFFCIFISLVCILFSSFITEIYKHWIKQQTVSTEGTLNKWGRHVDWIKLSDFGIISVFHLKLLVDFFPKLNNLPAYRCLRKRWVSARGHLEIM